ncbi:hypothetical protein NDU88_007053 [Pleurodeles waltl]|uniref:Uncharacterized protein n=1 Tax=Pleurodeles waltl TaxID=8319 RepID=A0AAV7U164_PLEWA|nr:hypothetical protein NDU88_007053 [Pleurodeles waltl]
MKHADDDKSKDVRLMLKGWVKATGCTSRDGKVSAPRMEAIALFGGARIAVETPWGACACTLELCSP